MLFELRLNSEEIKESELVKKLKENVGRVYPVDEIVEGIITELDESISSREGRIYVGGNLNETELAMKRLGLVDKEVYENSSGGWGGNSGPLRVEYYLRLSQKGKELYQELKKYKIKIMEPRIKEWLEKHFKGKDRQEMYSIVKKDIPGIVIPEYEKK